MPEHWSDRLAHLIPTSLYRRLVRPAAVGFFYHVISSKPLPHIRSLYPFKTPVAFERDLDYLQGHYTLISYEDLLAYHASGKKLPPNAAHLSFDDGCAECYTVVRPILLRRGLPCTFFITTSLIGNKHMLFRHKLSLCLEGQGSAIGALPSFVPDEARKNAAALAAWLRGIKNPEAVDIDAICTALGIDIPAYLAEHHPYLDEAQLAALYSDGFTLGAHSLNHPKLNTLDEAGVRCEIAGSCLAVAKVAGQGSVPFAFPFSAVGVDRALLRHIRAENPVVGLLFDSKGLRPDRDFIFQRIWADAPAPGSDPNQSNLPLHIRAAYEDTFGFRLRHLRRM
jgi:peptidoglycan/xylan/chitin deacetylase (PgdA/CDA1 family)